MLKQTLENLKKIRAVAETDVAGDFRTRPGREAQRTQAKAELPKLQAAFAAAFRPVGFPIFVTSNTQTALDFAELAGFDDYEVVVVDFEQATRNVRDAVRQTIGKRREFSPHAFTALIREVRQTGADLGLTSIPDLNYDGAEYLKDDAAVDALVNQYLLKYMGPEFLAAVIEKEAVRSATELACDSPVIPVLIAGVPAALQAVIGPRLLRGKFITGSISGAPTQEDVDTLFGVVKDMVKQ